MGIALRYNNVRMVLALGTARYVCVGVRGYGSGSGGGEGLATRPRYWVVWPLAAPIGLSPLLIPALCGPERVLVVSTEPLDDMSGAIKQRIQSSHMPPCHRHMVIATNFSSLFDLLLCSTPQTRAECCLELTAVSGYRMFFGPFGQSLQACTPHWAG